MNVSLLEAFDTVVQAEAMLGRLRDAQPKVARKQSFEAERQWLAVAEERLAAACAPIKDLPTRAARLPELEPVREDLARTLQGAAVDALERFQGALTFHAGPRAPVVEELFGALKLPVMRKLKREELEKALGAFGRKLRTQYVKRVLADEAFAFALPAVEKLNQSFDAWRGAFSSGDLSETDAKALREELTSLAAAVRLPLRQARLLAEAALLTVEGAFEEWGFAAKPKKRAAVKAPAPAVESVEAVAGEAAQLAEEAAPVEPPAVVASVELPEVPAPEKKAKAKKGAKSAGERAATSGR